jgi:acyl transferase domain-containing protein/thioesterase domain-containing protein
MESEEGAGYDIAIVGMSVRVPGATDPDQYWKNLRDGVESVQFYNDEELAQRGVKPTQLKNPHYVKAGAPLDDVAGFDPEFFGFSPKEAGILDPQHRQFYECSWEALERAGHVPESFDGAIGVFAGCGMGAYFAYNILTNPELLDSVGLFLLRHTGNDKDFLSTRVSYSFNLKGPSINVQTACSTSAVATHLACQSLMSGECDMALAGGVTLEIPHKMGYVYKEGEILSPDGHCRPFDHRSKGTIFGSGTGVVVLRRLEDALEDGDHIHAVISGSAINNDGSGKVGYLAPSVEGQAQAITEALAVADISADTIDYVECHGTGTPVGDPIEVSALTQAFRQTTDRNGFCGLGSVKSNIGHLDTAAGVASLIKTAMALENAQLPPSLNFEAPNPTIDFVNSPFFVNDSLKDWSAKSHPRRAAINSLGVGGTNAFLILEEPPKPEPSPESTRRSQLLVLSARNRNALDGSSAKLAQHLKDHPEQSLGDIAYTLFVGRRGFEHRRVIACTNHNEAITLLESNDPRRVTTHRCDEDDKSIVFMFPGGGAQYVNMGRDLYETEPVFRQHLDAGLAALKKRSDVDLRALLFAEEADRANVAESLQAPSMQLPAIFMIEYALAQLWISLGIEPEALIGHSMGENTAACLAGVISYEDAIGLVHLRGTLMDGVPEGGMLSVQLAASDLEQYLGGDLELASINSPGLSVASGPVKALESLAHRLTENGIESQRVKINIAAHSSMLDGILDEFGAYLRSIKLNAPKIPFVSNYTGTWITTEQATDPQYWVDHLRNTVQFAKGIDTLIEESGRVFLEVGPGNTLGSLTRQNPNAPAHRVFSSLRHPEDPVTDDSHFLAVLGRLWAVGVRVSQQVLWPEGNRKRIPLPTYAFQHKNYWIEPGVAREAPESAFAQLEKIEKIDNWYKRPVWIQRGILPSAQIEPCTWLFFLDDSGIGKTLAARLTDSGHKVITVQEGDAYYQISPTQYRLSPEAGSEGYSALISDLVAGGLTPDRIVHMWLLTEQESFRPGSSFFHRNQEYGFYSLFFLAKALGEENLIDNKIHLTVVSNGMQQVQEEPLPYPEKATALGPCKVIPREFSGVSCSSVDVSLPMNKSSTLFRKPTNNEAELATLVSALALEIQTPADNAIVAYRGGDRWEQRFDQLVDEKQSLPRSRLVKNGVYFITGGLGGIGFVMAQHLANTYDARLVLVNRTPLPERSQWAEWLKQHSFDDPISKNIQRIKELEDSGAEVLVLSGDVTDTDRMKQITAEAKEHFGTINGVLHAAGFVSDNLIQIKTQSEVEDVFTPKVYGTLVLDEVFRNEKLDFLVLFSSTSTAIAPVGQIDYVAANSFLNAYAQSQNNDPQRYTVAVNWGIWNEVGMAAKSAMSMGYGPKNTTQRSEPVEANYTLFEKRYTMTQGSQTTHVMSGHFSPKTHWVLDEHRTAKGQAILPGTAYIELARAALAECGEHGAFELRELIFFQALYIEDTGAKQVRIKLTESVEGYDFQIQSEQLLDDGQRGWETHAEARIIIKAGMEPTPVDLKGIIERCHLTPVDAKQSPAIRSKQEDHLNFGPRWQVLRQFAYGSNEAIAQLSLSEQYTDDLQDFALHPALLDLATGYAMELIKGYADAQVAANLWVPVSYASFNCYHALPAQIYSWVKASHELSVDNDFASFDITLFDSQGKVLAQIHQLTIKKLAGEVDFSASRSATELEMEEQAVSSEEHLRQLSPSEMAFQHNLSQGIMPKEGTAALTHILHSATNSQIIVSSLELDGLIAEAAATAATLQPEGESAKFSRPDLDNEYVEAIDDIESTLVGFWEELLGVDQVGTQDSFFELGGHSLIAVRLFSKIQQTFDEDYPISVLFEAPTISACAEMIRESLGDEHSLASQSDEGKKEQKHSARYTHLVPMHSGKPGNASPFFLVAGMFGNVLNLRHLAHLVGTERAFYGLQARGLYGDHEPHGTFEEMARDYIAEMKTVQPKGPYFLGGFSGGGITAFEIARQLRESGDEIAMLALLDSPLAHSEPLSSVDRMSIHWQRLSKKGASYFTEWAKNRYQWELQKFNKRFNIDPPEEQKSPFDFQSENIEIAFRKALDLYETHPLPIDVILFRPKLDKSYKLSGGRSANAVRQFVYEDNGWTDYVNDLTVFEVPGSHDSMVLEPNVRVLATKLASCISDAEKQIK